MVPLNNQFNSTEFSSFIHLFAFYDAMGIRRTHSRLTLPPGGRTVWIPLPNSVLSSIIQFWSNCFRLQSLDWFSWPLWTFYNRIWTSFVKVICRYNHKRLWEQIFTIFHFCYCFCLNFKRDDFDAHMPNMLKICKQSLDESVYFSKMSALNMWSGCLHLSSMVYNKLLIIDSLR